MPVDQERRLRAACRRPLHFTRVTLLCARATRADSSTCTGPALASAPFAPLPCGAPRVSPGPPRRAAPRRTAASGGTPAPAQLPTAPSSPTRKTTRTSGRRGWRACVCWAGLSWAGSSSRAAPASRGVRGRHAGATRQEHNQPLQTQRLEVWRGASRTAERRQPGRPPPQCGPAPVWLSRRLSLSRLAAAGTSRGANRASRRRRLGHETRMRSGASRA